MFRPLTGGLAELVVSALVDRSLAQHRVMDICQILDCDVGTVAGTNFRKQSVRDCAGLAVATLDEQ